jgi:hypothetical protein
MGKQVLFENIRSCSKRIYNDHEDHEADQLWKRSGEYLKATGDRDLASGRWLTNDFFIQTRTPALIAQAIHQIRSKPIAL